MAVEVSKIALLDVADNVAVEAELRDAIEDAQLRDWDKHWQPSLIMTLAELVRQGVPREKWPQSSHWNWPAKIAQIQGLLAFRGFSILSEGVTQGLMQVNLNHSARLPEQSGKPMVYVEYLEAAPWNRADLGEAPRYKGIGTALITAAVELSVQEGFRGRVGLHSLPQADNFYRTTCGMSDLGPDPAYQNRMRYFELTPESAQVFLQAEKGK